MTTLSPRFGRKSEIHLAAINNHVGTLRILIDEGKDINKLDHGETPLAVAIRARSIDAVKVLLEKGADTTKITRDVIENVPFLIPREDIPIDKLNKPLSNELVQILKKYKLI